MRPLKEIEVGLRVRPQAPLKRPSRLSQLRVIKEVDLLRTSTRNFWEISITHSLNYSFIRLAGGCRLAGTPWARLETMPSVARVLDYNRKTRDEASNFGGSMEEQEKEAVLIPCK